MSGNIKKIVEPNSGIDYSLEKDFKIFTLSKELPITTYPSYIRLGIVIYCVKGNAKIDIYSNPQRAHHHLAGAIGRINGR